MDNKYKEKNWAPLLIQDKKAESTQGATISYWKDVWRRFKQNKLSLVSIFAIIVIVVLCVIGPVISLKNYEDQQLELRNMPPRIEIVTAADGTNFYIHPELRLFLVDDKGKVQKMIEPTEKQLAKRTYYYEVNGNKYVLTFNGDGTKLSSADGTEITAKKNKWNKNYFLGTDSLGRDMLVRLLYGGRISLLVAFITTISTLLIGTMYGGIAGYYGGNVDVLMMRFVEILMSIPSTIYIILLMVYFGQGIYNILIVMAATSWLGMARLVRGQVLSLKDQEFVLAAKCSGVSPLKIILRHLIPNCLGPIIVSATLSIPGAIATEAFISFIGLGVAPPLPSWGILSNEGIGAINSAPYQILLPSIAISLTMFAFNFLGDGLRDALDPKLRK